MIKNKSVKFLLIAFLILILLLIGTITTNAVSASISCSSSGTVGTPISIQVSGTGVQWNLELKVNGTTIASNNELDNAEGNKNISFSGTYTPTQTGTITVTLEGSVTEASDGTTIRSFGSKTITVTEPAPEPEPEPQPEPEPEPTPEPETPEFNFTTITVNDTKYENGANITVPNETSSVKVQAVGTANYSTNVNGNSVSGFTVNLEEGTNTITVTDLNTGKTVSVYISRAAAVTETPPNVMENTEASENTVTEEPAEETGLRLATLNIEGLELSPKFDPSVYSYTVNIDMDKQDYSSLNIEAIANDETANVSIDGNQNLQEGENIINIILTSEDGEEIVTYQLIVNKITSSSEVVGPTIEDNNNQNMLILIGAVVVIAVIIIVAIILLVRRHKRINPDYDEYDGYGLYNYDLYNNPNDDNENNNENTQNYENDNVYKFEDSEEEKQETNTYNEYNDYNDYDDDFDGGKKKRRRGKGKHA